MVVIISPSLASTEIFYSDASAAGLAVCMELTGFLGIENLVL